MFHDYTSVEHAMVEVYTDADWASSKDDRRSISSCAIFYGGCLLNASSRTQKIVSLSSAESEMYAAASGACDAVLIVGILSWMLIHSFRFASIWIQQLQGVSSTDVVWAKCAIYLAGVFGSKDAWQTAQ